MTRTYQPGDRVHFDGDRTGNPTPEDHEEYEAPSWGTVVAFEDVSPRLRGTSPLPNRTPVKWDDSPNGHLVTEALNTCLVPPSEAPEPDPRES